MQDTGLLWNPKECSVIQVRKGKQVEDAVDLKLDETTLVANLKTGAKYVFLGVRESGQPAARRKPHLGNKPVRLTCLDVPHVDPTLAIGRAAK